MIANTATMIISPNTAAVILSLALSTFSLLPPDVTQANAPSKRYSKAANPAIMKNARIINVKIVDKVGALKPRLALIVWAETGETKLK